MHKHWILESKGMSLQHDPNPTLVYKYKVYKRKYLWSKVSFLFSKNHFKKSKVLEILLELELRQYKNDGIAERNLYILNLPRFSLA